MACVHDTVLLHYSNWHFCASIPGCCLLLSLIVPQLGRCGLIWYMDKLQSGESLNIFLPSKSTLYYAVSIHLHLQLLWPVQDQSALVLCVAHELADGPRMPSLVRYALDASCNRCSLQFLRANSSQKMCLFRGHGASCQDLIPWRRLQQMDLPFIISTYDCFDGFWLHWSNFELRWTEAICLGWKLRWRKGHRGQSHHWEIQQVARTSNRLKKW